MRLRWRLLDGIVWDLQVSSPWLKNLLEGNIVSHLGIAHRLMEDDFYNGYFIPKGLIIFVH